MNRKINAIYGLVAILVIWLSVNTHNINNTANETRQDNAKINEIIADMVKDTMEEKVLSKEYEDSYFPQVFAQYRALYGGGHTFEWNGSIYTTDYEEETITTPDTNARAWVLNSDDIDDYCKSNYHDECGTCDGDGATRWFADRDGDGLGDSTTFTTSCGDPLASK